MKDKYRTAHKYDEMARSNVGMGVVNEVQSRRKRLGEKHDMSTSLAKKRAVAEVAQAAEVERVAEERESKVLKKAKVRASEGEARAREYGQAEEPPPALPREECRAWDGEALPDGPYGGSVQRAAQAGDREAVKYNFAKRARFDSGGDK